MLTKKLVTGKRKTSIARLKIEKGTGKILVNGKDPLVYFKRETLVGLFKQSLAIATSAKGYNITARLTGGGLSGQAGALRHAIARAINEIEPMKHTQLKVNKFLTRDGRKVQRKLFGHKKARKSFQFSKR